MGVELVDEEGLTGEGEGDGAKRMREQTGIVRE
jgi:hypothetical protein